MEVATTNNHSQSHHHHHHHHLQAASRGGVGGGGGGGSGSGSRSPFQREVREWQRIDPNTGALFSGRLEADRWVNGPLNSYGKISDSQNISQPNGTQHTQRKQLEVLKARTANGAMQVIRTQTVQKSSSSWASSTSTTTTSTTHRTGNGHDPSPLRPSPLSPPQIAQGVDICELSDDDCSISGSDAGIVCTASATASASAATSASAVSQELIDDHVDFVVINGEASDQDDDEHLHKVGHNLLLDTAPSLKLSNLMKSSSSISSQSSNNSNLTTAANGNTHRSAGKISLHAIVGPESSPPSSSSLFSSSSPSSAWAKQADLYGQLPGRVGGAGTGGADVAAAPPTQRRDLESFRHYNDDDDDDDELRLTARHQRRQQVSQSVYAPPLSTLSGLGSTLLQRSRSISTDDLSNDWEREEPGEQPLGEWRRVSKLRRSFQSQDHYKSPASRPRPLDLPGSSVSVARLRAELENGRRLNTAMRNNHVDLAALDNILNTPKPTVAKRNTFLTAESLQEIRGKLKKLSDESLYKEDFLAYHQKKPLVREVSVEKATPLPPAPSAFRAVHNTHSLESRQRQKDTSSSEWHLRRKSYGFEKMSPPEDKSIFRVDASTDSGLGRSGEQLGNWSPTERERHANQQHNGSGGTVIHFGRSGKAIPAPSSPDSELSKRHSIAVEETWRDIRKTSQVQVNGGTTTTTATTNASSHLQRGNAQKRVEFCKTEVHFAAESGRVNIVETDGKPPPTQNFRRRRRTASGPLQSLVKSASAGSSSSTQSEVTHFGDDSQRRKTIATSTVAYRATLMDPPEVVSQPTSTNGPSIATQVTVTTVAKPVHEPRYSLMESTSRNSYTSTSGVDTTDNETDELSNIRGILKNKPIKPKPYHLGENIESADVLWSVPAMKADRESQSPSARDSGTTSDSPISSKSVAERIRIVEQRQQQQQKSPAGNGYSTKINVSLGNEEWPESDLPKSNVMNIALHAPRVEKPKPTPPTLRIGQLIPVAKPRTLFIQPQIQQPTATVETPDDSGSETLKIVKEARGARKLREHELSYFGVQHQQQQQQTKLSTTSSNPRRTLPSRSKVSHSEEPKATTTKTTTRWQLLSDRPDLLRHSSPQTNGHDEDLEEDEDHCYENIANIDMTPTFRVKSPAHSPERSRSPNSYERKSDLQRDAQILSEMTRNADQTMKALSDEAAIKDQRRRSCSLQRRSAKPLETIDEKVKVYSPPSLGVARGTFASEARRNSRQSTPSPSRARSSSVSSVECCPRDRSRSSSRESMTHGGGSSDDQVATKHRAERLRLRTPKREKSRHEPLEVRIKPRSSVTATATSSLESKRSSHSHSRHVHSRDVEHSGESKTSSGSRLMRSSRTADESRSRQSGQREREKERERSRGSEKHREELSRSRGHSSRSRHSEHSSAGTRESGSTRPSKTRSSRTSSHDKKSHTTTTTTTTTGTTATSKSLKSSSKSTAHKPSSSSSAAAAAATAVAASTTATGTGTAPSTQHNELTYVYVTNTNLANTQASEGESPKEADYASIEETETKETETPQPPPRSKRKRSLIPVPVAPTPSYEYRTKLEMIPPSYSNQSTLRCRSSRKPSLKATQSTSSSFAFLPYLPAKRNSSVSHVYDNYLLYATSEEAKLRPYQNNLSNDHAQLFGGGGAAAGTGSWPGKGTRTRAAERGRLGGWPKRLRMRQVRSSVSTHQPFGICTCS